MEPIQSNDNSNSTMMLTTTPDVPNMLASLIKLQQSLAFQIRNLKDDVDRMKVSSVSQKSKVTYDTKQKPHQNHLQNTRIPNVPYLSHHHPPVLHGKESL
ncbi:hypothetical protein O181_058406 [Austropuccinia psidii MF-1]|uniref:Uncharacterized protein n=1 Tax=Austropuccinia psidii MF-1 TaxID=1389203 RepID=A0A9Q3EH03_9BASI|nr:hypothetical protein [Austropuccinia psidii MF-1]